MKLLTTILALLITILSVLPCCPGGNCDSEKAIVEHAAPDSHPSEGKVCSPFYSCAACTGFTWEVQATVAVPFQITTPSFYKHYPAAFISSFHHSIWQPPRMG
ncbi:DUF6660 family protein [Pontibacter sp. MBLB2868]|uniref:DUF6660 family protein n=1 Tax=Pontibacter sp. MBLB2868 TaxID=3451555 RepID=UPI003F74D135